jgi:hypothetical protein
MHPMPRGYRSWSYIFFSVDIEVTGDEIVNPTPHRPFARVRGVRTWSDNFSANADILEQLAC